MRHFSVNLILDLILRKLGSEKNIRRLTIMDNGHPFPAKLADYVCPATQQTRSVASFVFGAEVVNTFYYDNCHAAVRRHIALQGIH